jgi:hypothetical protein
VERERQARAVRGRCDAEAGEDGDRVAQRRRCGGGAEGGEVEEEVLGEEPVGRRHASAERVRVELIGDREGWRREVEAEERDAVPQRRRRTPGGRVAHGRTRDREVWLLEGNRGLFPLFPNFGVAQSAPTNHLLTRFPLFSYADLRLSSKPLLNSKHELFHQKAANMNYSIKKQQT